MDDKIKKRGLTLGIGHLIIIGLIFIGIVVGGFFLIVGVNQEKEPEVNMFYPFEGIF